MNIVQADPEHFNLFPEIEIFKRVINPTCPFGQLVYDGPLCCLKREGPDPYCDKDNCPKLKGIKKCKPIPKICDSCPAHSKNKIRGHVII